MDTGELQHAPIDPTDVIALVAMALFSVRRLKVKLAEAKHFPHVPPQLFESWRASALSAYTLALRACFLKFFLNTLWYYGARGLGPAHAAGGAAIFVAWVAALVFSWYRITEVGKRQAQLGIVLRGRPPEA